MSWIRIRKDSGIAAAGCFTMLYYLQEKYINLLTDFGFKRVFGTEPNKQLLLDFLNTLLPPAHQIAELSFKNSEHVGNTPLDRKAIFDIYCQGANGERFIVEIQKAKQNYFKDRSVFYSTFPIQEQAQQGIWNYKLTPVYAIGVLDFVFNDDNNDGDDNDLDSPKDVVHTVELKDQHCNVFYDKLKFIYIELPKFHKTLDQLSSRFDKWMYVLKNLPDLNDRPTALQEEVFSELFRVAEIANFSPTEQDSYQNSLKYYRDLNNVVDTSREEGRAEGRKEGRAEGREEGRAEGLKEGLLQGRRSQLLDQLSYLLGEIPAEVVEQVNQITEENCDALGKALLKFKAIADLQEWLAQRMEDRE